MTIQAPLQPLSSAVLAEPTAMHNPAVKITLVLEHAAEKLQLNARNFFRALKRWRGKSPREFPASGSDRLVVCHD